MASSYTPPGGRLKPRKSAAYNAKPLTPSGLSKSTSTPYELYSNSPSRQSSVSSTPLRNPAFPPSLAESSDNSPVFRRNAGFGSPGLRASLGTPRSSHDGSTSPLPTRAGLARQSARGDMPSQSPRNARASRAFIRKKPWTERLKSAPVDLFFQLQSHLMDFEDVFHEPALGYPIGIALHILSLISHLISPDSSLGASLAGKPGKAFGTSPAFGRPSNARNAGSAAKSQQLRKLTQGKAQAWLRWTSIGLSLALLIVACYNAYILFTSRRKYRLWMRNENEKISSENSRLVPAYIDDAEKPTIQEQLTHLCLKALRQVPILGWFAPAQARPPSPVEETRIHELDVWQAPEVPLRIFSIFSPAHALWWQAASLLGVSGLMSWLFSIAMMALFAFQFHFLVHVYKGMVKDRILLSAEVMHEYDQKFVLPRAMPLVRDASTMTSQAETISPSDLF